MVPYPEEKNRIASSLLEVYKRDPCSRFYIKHVIGVHTQRKLWMKDADILCGGGEIHDILKSKTYMSDIWKLMKLKGQAPITTAKYYDPFWLSYSKGYTELSWLLLKHDITFLPPMTTVPTCKRWPRALGETAFLPRLIEVFMDNLTSYNCQSRRRLRTVLWGLDAITYINDDPRVCDKKVACLKMLYKFVPEPYIASAEIERLLKYIYRFKMDSFEYLVRRACEKFEAYFPESTEPYQPRSLKHLCRCCIHQKLRKDRRLPYGVKDLNIPEHLRDYILPEKNPFTEENIPNVSQSFSEELQMTVRENRFVEVIREREEVPSEL